MGANGSMFTHLVPVFIVLVAAVVFIAAFVLDRRQRDRVMAYAQQHGLTYTRRDRELGKFLRDNADVGGHSHTAVNILENVPSSSAPDAFRYGELRWKTGSGDDETSHDREFFLFPIPANFPATRLKPEGFFGRAMNDINTEWMEFNKEWDVRSDNPHFASALLSPRMQEFLMEVTGNEFYLRPGTLLVLGGNYQHERCYQFLDLALHWRSLVVPFLWQDYGSR